MNRVKRTDFTIQNTNELKIDYNYREIEALKYRIEYLEKKQIEDKQLLLLVIQQLTSAIEDLKKKVNKT